MDKPFVLTPSADDPVATLVFFLLVFLVVGVFFLFVHLLMGSFIRPKVPEPEKLTIYECGEPTVGSAWIQFDLRFYVVALLFVIFDVEVAFFFPWAAVFGTANQLANLPPVAEKPAKEADIKEWQKIEAKRKELSEQLQPSGVSGKMKESRKLTHKDPITPEAAFGWAKVALLDLLVFFGVLLVGFAYVWRRGDIDWVRSVTHRGGEHPVGQEPPPTGTKAVA